MRKYVYSSILIAVLILISTIPVVANSQPSDDQNKGQTAYIDVSVATFWSEPDLDRPIDKQAVSNPVDLWKWTTNMTLAEKLWLVGNLQTQGLYGQEVTILEDKGEWVKAALHGQPTPKHELGYPAWVKKSHLTTNQRFSNIEHRTFALVTAPTSWIYKDSNLKNKFKEISFNTRLPILKEKEKAILVGTPNDGNKWISAEDVAIYDSSDDIPSPTGKDIVDTAEQFKGLPYLWSGASGFGFDCSGFTHTIYKAHGITIPRDSSVQAIHGDPVQREDLQKGDLIFFAYNKGKGRVHHVSIYVGDGKMIHSPNSSSAVEVIPLEGSSYEVEYAGARRYIQ